MLMENCSRSLLSLSHFQEGGNVKIFFWFLSQISWNNKTRSITNTINIFENVSDVYYYKGSSSKTKGVLVSLWKNFLLFPHVNHLPLPLPQLLPIMAITALFSPPWPSWPPWPPGQPWPLGQLYHQAKWATTPADEKIYPEESSELALFTLSCISAASTMEAWKMFNCSCSPNPQSLPTGQLAEGAAKNLLPTRVGEGDAITDHERQNQEKWI